MNRKLARYIVPERIPWFAAGLYDKLAGRALKTYYSKVAEEIVAHIADGHILDIGTGPGYLPIQVAKMAPDIRIDGIDLSSRLIKIAQTNAKNAGVADRLSFRVGDANSLDLADASYRMVISTGSLHAWRYPVKVMNECHRVLIPGGQAWIYDPAKISAEDEIERAVGSRGILDRLGYLWATVTNKAVKPYSLDEVRQFANTSRFDTFSLVETDWLRLKLVKG